MVSQDSGNKAEKPAGQEQGKGKQNWQACSRCDQRYLPARMVERMQKEFPENVEVLGMCPRCRRKKTAEALVLAKGTVEKNI